MRARVDSGEGVRPCAVQWRGLLSAMQDVVVRGKEPCTCLWPLAVSKFVVTWLAVIDCDCDIPIMMCHTGAIKIRRRRIQRYKELCRASYGGTESIQKPQILEKICRGKRYAVLVATLQVVGH